MIKLFQKFRRSSFPKKLNYVGGARLSHKNEKVADVLYTFFTNVVSNIPKYHDKLPDVDYIEGLTTASVEQYENHPIIVAKKSKSTNKYFTFNSISKLKIEKEILNLNSSKACQDSNIPIKIIKFNSDIFIDPLYIQFSISLDTSAFPPRMKLAN